MKLSALAGESFASNPEITGLTADSRAVREGFLFAALSGGKVDGAAFVPQAEKSGAAAVLSRPGVVTSVAHVIDDNPRARLAKMAARFYPRQPEIVAGVTGTNGKTSTAVFAAQLWRMLGRGGGSLGTLGAQAGEIEIRTGLTTPDPVRLHEILNELAMKGVDRLAMEVSSHAIDQARADGVRFRIAAFTNITQDHLDYHASFDAYFDTKASLFTRLLADDGVAVINADGKGAAELQSRIRARGAAVMTTGANGADVRFVNAKPTPTGIMVSVLAAGDETAIELPLIGLFQAENAMLAAGIVIASGEAPARVIPLLARLSGVPGRMQFAAAVNGAGIYVDYAHTPDAVATALKAIRPHAKGRVIAIIGAGGDRDRMKRPLMGQAAAEGADIVIVTDDNPRTEKPSAIRAEIMRGCPDAVEIGDRGAAIAEGAAMLKEGDVVLIAGKGHETGQQVGDQILPFNDVEMARAAASMHAAEDGRW